MKVSAPRMSLDDSDGRLMPSTHTAAFGDLWRVLALRKVWVLGVAAACLGLAVCYLVVTPTRYTAVAEILVDPRDRQILANGVTPDALPADGGVIQVESQARIIESDSVLLRAVDTLGLDHDPEFGASSGLSLGSLVRRLQGLFGAAPSGDAKDARDQALRVLRRHLSVKRADKVFVIDVGVSASSADRAARISDAVAEAYIADQVATRATAARRASDSLAGRLADQRDSVRDAETRVERYKRDHDLVGTDKELVSDQQLEDAGRKLADARAHTADLRARVDQLEALRKSGGDPGSVPEAMQSPLITQLRGAAQDLVRRESDLRTRLGDRHPDLVALAEQVKEVRRQITAELARLARSAHSDYDRALSYQQQLAADLEKSKSKTLTSGQASIELRELTRELDARRSLYSAFLARAAETRAQANIDSFNARILSKAIPPDKPSWPPRLLIVLGALVGGLGLGASVAFGLDYAAPAILSPDQVEPFVEGPVIAVASGPGHRRRPWPLGAARADTGDDMAIAFALGRLRGPLAALRGAPQPYALLLASAPCDEAARRGAAVRIARVAARQGLSVLLVEADLARGDGREAGFLDVLRGDNTVDDVALAETTPGVRRLPLGLQGGRGAMAPRVAAVRRFIEDAGRYFDLIVFEGGAPEQNLAIAPLTGEVDDAVLVATQGRTPVSAIEGAAEAMRAFSGRAPSAAMLFPASARG